jgi:hypothetical protein
MNAVLPSPCIFYQLAVANNLAVPSAPFEAWADWLVFIKVLKQIGY